MQASVWLQLSVSWWLMGKICVTHFSFFPLTPCAFEHWAIFIFVPGLHQHRNASHDPYNANLNKSVIPNVTPPIHLIYTNIILHKILDMGSYMRVLLKSWIWLVRIWWSLFDHKSKYNSNHRFRFIYAVVWIGLCFYSNNLHMQWNSWYHEVITWGGISHTRSTQCHKLGVQCSLFIHVYSPSSA